MEIHGSDDEVPDSSDSQGSPKKRSKRNSKTLESPFLQRHPKYVTARQGHCVGYRVCQKSCIYGGLEKNEKGVGSGAFSPNKVKFMLNPSAWFPNMHLSESSDEAYSSGISSGLVQRSTSSEYPGDQLQLQRVSLRRQRSSSSSHVSKSEKRTSRSSKVRSVHSDISKEICLGNNPLTVSSDLDPDKVKDNPSCHCTACCHCHGNGQGKGCSHHQVVCEILSNSSSENALSSSLHENDFNLPSPTFISSWGYFSKSKKNHYKYRRSDYSSDSDDDVPLKGLKINADANVITAQRSHLPMTKLICLNSTNSVKGREKNDENSKVVPQIPFMALNEGVKPLDFKERMKTIVEWFTEFSDEQKNIFIKEILNGCDLPQLHLLSVKMEANLHNGCPPNCQDIITWLPSNLATKVMSYLDPVSLCRASQVCKVWYQLANDQTFWRRFCCQTKWRLSKAAEHKQVISHMTPEGSIQWKKVFAERFRLRNNWLSGRCTVRTFEGHSQGISCVQFDDTRIVSGSSDKTIKVWNIRTNAQWSVQTLVGHSGTVRCLHLEGNRLVSGSTDKTIKVWDLSTQESWSSIACKVTMTGHLDTVRCLQEVCPLVDQVHDFNFHGLPLPSIPQTLLIGVMPPGFLSSWSWFSQHYYIKVDDIKVISGSYDKTLKVWDILTGQCKRTLRGHQAAVLCVHFNDTKIVSGSCDKTIKVWNYEGECVMTLTGHQDAVTCLQFDSTRVISGSLDCNLKFWDIHSGECISTIDWKASEGHTGVVRCLQADSWRLVSAADDKTIKVWNLETGKRLITLRNHTDGVTCLQFNDFIIVSGSYDKTVKLWDFSCC